ncbi:MAG: DMT family transporter [Rhodobacteraceae bacterium]|nr:DMT family transporter [Paracoccaceae bacterium]
MAGRSENLTAGLMMVAAMTLFAVQDVSIKLLAGSLTPGQIVLLIGAGGLPVLLVLAAARGEAPVSRDLLGPAVLARNGFEFLTAICVVKALSLVPLSLVTAIMQSVPLLVTAGAALWFGEPVGWRRWTAISVGMAGVLVILRPGMEGFDPSVLWALAGAGAMAARDLATRAVPRAVTSLRLSTWAFAVLVPAGLLLIAVEPRPHVWPDAGGWMLVGAMVVPGLLAYGALVIATRTGDIAAVAPLRYSRILVALALGALVFGERPDAAALAGIGLVVGSGLYTLLREARQRRTSSPAAGAPV